MDFISNLVKGHPKESSGEPTETPDYQQDNPSTYDDTEDTGKISDKPDESLGVYSTSKYSKTGDADEDTTADYKTTTEDAPSSGYAYDAYKTTTDEDDTSGGYGGKKNDGDIGSGGYGDDKIASDEAPTAGYGKYKTTDDDETTGGGYGGAYKTTTDDGEDYKSTTTDDAPSGGYGGAYKTTTDDGDDYKSTTDAPSSGYGGDYKSTTTDDAPSGGFGGAYKTTADDAPSGGYGDYKTDTTTTDDSEYPSGETKGYSKKSEVGEGYLDEPSDYSGAGGYSSKPSSYGAGTDETEPQSESGYSGYKKTGGGYASNDY